MKLQNYARVSRKEISILGRTALHWAIQQYSTEIASFLLSYGANIDAVDYSGKTPAHLACQEGMIDTVCVHCYFNGSLGRENY